jgi:cytochrome c oxidase cbb3-type subunit 1
LIATSFYVVQRTSGAAVGAATSPGSCSGATSCSSSWRRPAICWASPRAKEYAEPEWYVDLWLTIVWVAYLLVFIGTLWKRKEPHIYVANWFYLAFIVTIAMLHVVNNLAMPVSRSLAPRATRPLPACRMR